MYIYLMLVKYLILIDMFILSCFNNMYFRVFVVIGVLFFFLIVVILLYKCKFGRRRIMKKICRGLWFVMCFRIVVFDKVFDCRGCFVFEKEMGLNIKLIFWGYIFEEVWFDLRYKIDN